MARLAPVVILGLIPLGGPGPTIITLPTPNPPLMISGHESFHLIASGADKFGRTGHVSESFVVKINKGMATADASLSLGEISRVKGCLAQGAVSGSVHKASTTAFAYRNGTNHHLYVGLGGLKVQAGEQDHSNCGTGFSGQRTRYEAVGRAIDITAAMKNGPHQRHGSTISGTEKQNLKTCALPGPPGGQIWPQPMPCQQQISYYLTMWPIK